MVKKVAGSPTSKPDCNGNETSCSTLQCLFSFRSKGRLSINILVNVFRLPLNVFLGILIVPFLIHKLGFAYYGLIPLASYFVEYLSLASHALNSAVGRFMAVALEKGDKKAVNGIFNTVFKANIGLSGGLAIASVPIIIYLDRFVELPPGAAFSGRYLFGCTCVCFFLDIAFSVFGATVWCRNRFDLLAVIQIVRRMVYFVLVWLFLSSLRPSLFWVGNGVLISGAVASFISFRMSRLLLPELKIVRGAFNWSILKELFSTGLWITVNMVGAILFLRTDLIIINKFFGSAICGIYASLLIWPSFLRTVGGAVSAAFGPPFAYLVANSNQKELRKYAAMAVRLVGIFTVLPIGLICGFSRPLLCGWGETSLPLPACWSFSLCTCP